MKLFRKRTMYKFFFYVSLLKMLYNIFYNLVLLTEQWGREVIKLNRTKKLAEQNVPIFYFPRESELASRKQFGVRGKRVCKISDSYRLGATYSIVTQIRDSAYCVSKHRIHVCIHVETWGHTRQSLQQR